MPFHLLSSALLFLAWSSSSENTGGPGIWQGSSGPFVLDHPMKKIKAIFASESFQVVVASSFVGMTCFCIAERNAGLALFWGTLAAFVCLSWIEFRIDMRILRETNSILSAANVMMTAINSLHSMVNLNMQASSVLIKERCHGNAAPNDEKNGPSA